MGISYGYDDYGRETSKSSGGKSFITTYDGGSGTNNPQILLGKVTGTVSDILSGGGQKLDYRYDIMGWLTTINQPLKNPPYVQNPLLSCDDTNVELIEEIDTNFITIKEAIERRFEVDLKFPYEEECTECPKVETCTPQELIDLKEEYETYIEILTETISTPIIIECAPDDVNETTTIDSIEVSTLVFPIKILEIELCNYSRQYLPESFIASYTGQYVVKKEIILLDEHQKIELFFNGTGRVYSVISFLDYIINFQEFDGTPAVINGGSDIICEEVCETIYIDCDPSEVDLQNEIIAVIKEEAKDIDIKTIMLPFTMYNVALCSGETLLLFESEYDKFNGINVTIIDSIIFDEDTKIIIDEDEDANEDIFYISLDYNLVGNILSQTVQVAGRGQYIYDYSYDNIDRLNSARFKEVYKIGNRTFKTTNNAFGVDGITYDPDGNIQTLNRRGIFEYCDDGRPRFGPIDQLTYNYVGGNPNRLNDVSDASGVAYGFPGGAGEFSYDPRGNLTKDPYRGIDSIQYNYLNLPDHIMTNGFNIDNYYDSGGNRWR